MQRLSDFINVIMSEVEFSSVLPAGMSDLTADFWGNWANMTAMLPSAPSLPFGGPKSAVDNEEFLPGTRLAAEEGLYAKVCLDD